MTIIERNTGKAVCIIDRIGGKSFTVEEALDLVFTREEDEDGIFTGCWLDESGQAIYADELLQVFWDEIPEDVPGAKLFVVEDQVPYGDSFSEYFDSMGQAVSYALGVAIASLRDAARPGRRHRTPDTVSISAYSITKEQYNDCLDEGDDASTWQLGYYEMIS